MDRRARAARAGGREYAGNGVNSSSIAGFGLGLGVAVAALVGLAVLAPVPDPPRPEPEAEITAPPPAPVPEDVPLPEPDLPPVPAPEPEQVPEPDAALRPTPEAAAEPEAMPAPAVVSQPDPESALDGTALTPPFAAPDSDAADSLPVLPPAPAPLRGDDLPTGDALQAPARDDPALDDPAPADDGLAAVMDGPAPHLPQMPDIGAPPAADATPRMPRDIAPLVTTQPLPILSPLRETGAGLPRMMDPAPFVMDLPDVDDAAEADARAAPAPALQPAPAPLPGTPVPLMPGQWQPPLQAPENAVAAPQPEEEAALLPALQRNAVMAAPVPGAALMGLILHDPGLPTPLRRELAAREIDFAVALNPMDPSAGGAAEIYRAAGKEVLILAHGIPVGADASDLDVTFNSFFETLPQAVAVMDVPTGGFTRNTRLLDGVLPLIARDGHGLVSFAGGTGQAARSAAAADIRHAEVFRVLDAAEESPFTIRRFLDRAVFQASQVGYVLVFGDASNSAMLDAIDLWLEMGRVDDISLVPVSAILLRE